MRKGSWVRRPWAAAAGVVLLWLCGCGVIVGAVAAAETVIVAESELGLPPAFDTRTQ